MSELIVSHEGASMLVVRDITKTYPKAADPVLQDVSLDVQKGQFVSLLGPSGCGKTTLLRVIAGLTSPDAGEITLAGRESMGPSREKAVVFQHFNLFPWRTALQNVAYGLELAGVSKDERLSRSREILRLVGLDGAEGKYPSELSGGMQQRVGLARAFVTRPRVMLMDEPFGALDALTRERLQGQLSELCQEHGLTVVFVTHSIDEAIYLSDRILVMGTAPANILREFQVKIPRPRSATTFRTHPDYATTRSAIWDLLEHRPATTSA